MWLVAEEPQRFSVVADGRSLDDSHPLLGVIIISGKAGVYSFSLIYYTVCQRPVNMPIASWRDVSLLFALQ